MSERFTAYRYILAQAVAESCWIGVPDPVLHQLDDACSCWDANCSSATPLHGTKFELWIRTVV